MNVSRVQDTNVVRVRIWRSCFIHKHTENIIYGHAITSALYGRLCNTCSQYDCNVGHVSLETHEIYVSLWPRFQLNLPILRRSILIQPGQLKNRVEQDIMAEGRHPDEETDLLTLDVDNINQEFQRFVRFRPRYIMMGRDRKCRMWDANSCCGLVYDLLITGGIRRLVSQQCIVRDHFLTTPNNILDLIETAYQEEKRNM